MISAQHWQEVRAFLQKLGDPQGLTNSESLPVELSRYFELLYKKNEDLNLTAIKDIDSIVWKHLADSLALIQWESLGTLLDWGSGGGLPGIPMALARKSAGQSAPVFFLDSVGKKLRAVEEFSQELGLTQSRFFCGRGEALIRDGSLRGVDSVVMRAVAPAEKALEWLHKSVPRWVLMLGPQQLESWQKHEGRVRNRGFRFARKAQYDLPRELGQRILLELVRA